METNLIDERNTLVFKNATDFSCTRAVVITSFNAQFATLSECEPEDFNGPLVLYFKEPNLQHLVNFNLKFPVEVILVNESNLVSKTFTEPFRGRTSPYILGFSCLNMVILCPQHFMIKHKIIKDETIIKLCTYNLYMYSIEQQKMVKDPRPITNAELKWRLELHKDFRKMLE